MVDKSNILIWVWFALFTTLISCGDKEEDNGMPSDDGMPAESECTVVQDMLSFPNTVNIFGMAAMANDTEAVYIYQYSETDGGSILRILKSSHTADVVVEGMGGLNNLAIDNTHIYWLEYDISGGTGQVKRTLKSGQGNVEILAEGKPQKPDGSTSDFDVFFPNGLVLDGDFLYWGEEVGGSAIRKISKTGGSVEDIGRGENLKPVALHVDDDNIYVLDSSNGSQVLAFSKADVTKAVLASGFSSVQAFSNLELNNNTLYWTEITDNGKAFSLSVTGGAVSTIKGSLTNPRNIFSTGNNTYIAAGNGIFKVNQDGSEVDIFCSNISVPFTITLDDTNIFIVDRPNVADAVGQIVKTDN